MNRLRDALEALRRRWARPTPKEIVREVAAAILMKSEQPIALGELKRELVRGLAARNELDERTTIEAMRYVKRYANYNPWPKSAGMI